MDQQPVEDPTNSLDSGTDDLEMPSTRAGTGSYSANSVSSNLQQGNRFSLKNRFSDISPRTVMVMSAIITLIVLLITSLAVLLFTNDHGENTASTIPTQDIDLSGPDEIESDIFTGKDRALFVNGDIIAEGTLSVNDNGQVIVIQPASLSEDQTITLPNSSGVVCLNSNNCNYITAQQLESQLGQIVIPTSTGIPASSLVNSQVGEVSIQGTSNRVSVSTNNGVIRLSTPQDLATVSSPNFANLALSGNLNVGGNLFLPLNCTSFLNGGSLTTNSNGRVICADDETSGGGTSVTTSGGTPGVIPVFTAADEIEDSIISQALGTITIGGSLDVSTNVTFSNFANGFLRVNGSGAVSVNTIDLGTDTDGNYVLGLTAGDGLNIGGVAGEGWTPSVSLSLQANKGLEVDGNGLSLVDCSSGEVLKYNGSNQWACATDNDTTGTFSIDADSGVPETVNNGDTINFSGGNNITTSVDPTDTITIDTVNDPNFTTSVTTPLLQSSGALSITPGGALSIGATGQTALLQGSTTTITSNGAGNDIVLTTADQIRLTGFNCSTFDNGGLLTTDASGNISCANDDGDPPNGVTGSGTTNRLAIFTGSQAIGDSWILQNGSTLELDATRNLSLLGGNLSVVGTGLFSGLITANGGLTIEAGDTFTFNGDAFTDLTGTGLTISTGSLQTTLGTSVDLGAEVNGTLPIANGGTGLGATPTNGQLLIGNGTGYTLATLTEGAGMTITNGVGSITVASAFGASVDLGVDTTGDYVEDITAGNGLTGSASGPGSNPVLALGPLTADWNQTGAFDVVLNNASSELRILESAGATFYGTLDVGDLTANRTYTLPDDDGEVCLVEAGNCAGSGTGVTTSGGTTNRLAKFTAGQNIEDSAVSEDGSNVTILGSVDLVVQGGDATLGTSIQDGSLTIYNNGFGALVQASLTGPQTYTLPDGSGEVCIKEFGNCSGGAGGNAPVTAQYLTLALDGTLTAERVLAFNGTNFSVVDGGANGSYSVNTVQNIHTGATPTFAGLTLTGNLNVAANTISGTTAVIDFTNFDVAANGNTTVGGTLDVSGLTTLTGGLTVQLGDTFTFNGDAFTDLTGTGLTISTGSLQTTLGTSVDLAAEVNGILPIANGGTGASSQQSAINSLSGLITEGDLLYFDGADSTRLARGANGECLISNATTLVWSSCTAGSITGLTLAGTSGTPQAISNGDTITIAAGSNITTTAVATDTVTVDVVSSPTFSGTVTAAAFSGDGSALTDLDADQLTSGTVASGRISGDYTGITGVGTLNAGSIDPSFGAIDTGSDDITTTGTLSGGNVTVSGSQFTNNGSTLNTAQALGDFPAGGSIGSAATTVDVDTSFSIAQTTAGQTLSLPSPTDATAGRIAFVLNTGSASFTMHGITIPAGYGQIYAWNGTSWILGASGGGSAITLQVAYDGGSTLTTTDARDIDFTLADTTTDANFTIDIASGSTGEFQIQSNGTDVLQIGPAGQLQLDVQGSSGGILLGGDVNLYRSNANQLSLGQEDDLIVFNAAGDSLTFGADVDSAFIYGSNNLAGDWLLAGQVSGDANERVILRTDGTINWGNGTVTQDTNLYRGAANTLATDDNFQASGYITAFDSQSAQVRIGEVGPGSEAGILFGSGGDTQIYRNSADRISLGTDDSFRTINTQGDILDLETDAGSVWLSNQSTSASDWVLGSNVSGDADQRYTLFASGFMQWGDGTNPPDTSLSRGAADHLYVGVDDSFRVFNTDGDILDLQADPTGVFLNAVATSASDWAIASKLSGDADQRYVLRADGEIRWGDGANPSDTNLFRAGANTLQTDDDFITVGDITVQGGDLLTNQTIFNLFNTTATTLNIGGAVGAGGINLAGGSGSTGCTINGANGNLTCSGSISSTATSGTQGWWDRTGTTLQPANAGDNIDTTGDIFAGSEVGIDNDGIFSWGGSGFSTSIQAADNGVSSYMQFQVNGGVWLSVGNNGATTFQRASDSTDAFVVQNAAGTLDFFNVDTLNETVGIGGPTTVATLKVTSSTVGQVGLVVNKTVGTDDLFQLQNGGTDVVTVGNTGNTLFQNSSDASDAFLVQNAAGNTLFNVDTSEGGVVIGADSGPLNITDRGQLRLYSTGTSGAGSRLFFGDGNDTTSQNVWIGERGTTDTDQLLLKGDGGIGLDIGGSGEFLALDIDGDGHATFQAATDTATAFQIQNSSSASLFTVDTSGSNITIDNSTDLAIDGGDLTIDSGTGSSITSILQSTGNSLILSYLNGEGEIRFKINAQGHMAWGDGTNPEDTELFRSAANTLSTGSGDDFIVGDDLIVTDELRLGTAGDTILYRGGANIVQTDDNVFLNTGELTLNESEGIQIQRADEATHDQGINFVTSNGIDWSIYQPAGSSELRFWNDLLSSDAIIFDTNGKVTLNTTTDEALVVDSFDAGDNDTWIQLNASGVPRWEVGVSDDTFFLFDDTDSELRFTLDGDTGSEITLGNASTEGLEVLLDNGDEFLDVEKNTYGTEDFAELILGQSGSGTFDASITTYTNDGSAEYTVGTSDSGPGGTDGFSIYNIPNDTDVLWVDGPNGRIGVSEGLEVYGAGIYSEVSGGAPATFNRTTSDGTLVSFERDGSEVGSISVSSGSVDYNAFTGSHYALAKEKLERGTLVSMTGDNSRFHDKKDSEILYGVEQTTKTNDPAVLGSYLSLLNPENEDGTPRPESNSNPSKIMAAGNGDMWVVDNRQDLKPGDNLISSDTPGHAMKDPGTFETSHVIAKVAEPINWDQVTEKTVNGKKHKLISVLFAPHDVENVGGSNTQGATTGLTNVQSLVAVAVLTAIAVQGLPVIIRFARRKKALSTRVGHN